MTTPPLYDDILDRSRRRQRGESVGDRPGQYDEIVERSRQRRAEGQQQAVARARTITRPSTSTPMDRPVDPGVPGPVNGFDGSGGGVEWDDARGFGTNLGRSMYDAAVPRTAEYLGSSMQTVADALPQDGVLGMGTAPLRTGLRGAGRALEDVGGRNRLAPPRVTSIGDALDSPENFRDYLGSTLGEGLGSSAGVLAAGAVGGIPGALAFSYGQQVGEVGQEFREVAPEMDPTQRARASMGLAVPLAALDMVTEMGALRGARQAITGEAKDYLARRSAGEIARSIGGATLKGAATEGATEAAQEGGQYFGVRGIAGKPMDLAEGLARMGEAGIAGALPGAVMGAGGKSFEEVIDFRRRARIPDAQVDPIGGLLPGQRTPDGPDFEVSDDFETPPAPVVETPSAATPPRPGNVPDAPAAKRQRKPAAPAPVPAAPVAPVAPPQDLASALDAEVAASEPAALAPDFEIEPDVMPTPEEMARGEGMLAEVETSPEPESIADLEPDLAPEPGPFDVEQYARVSENPWNQRTAIHQRLTGAAAQLPMPDLRREEETLIAQLDQGLPDDRRDYALELLDYVQTEIETRGESPTPSRHNAPPVDSGTFGLTPEPVSAPSSERAPLPADRPDDLAPASPAPAPAARDERPVAPVADAGGAPRVEPVLPGDGRAPGAEPRQGRDDTGAVSGGPDAAPRSGGVARPILEGATLRTQDANGKPLADVPQGMLTAMRRRLQQKIDQPSSAPGQDAADVRADLADVEQELAFRQENNWTPGYGAPRPSPVQERATTEPVAAPQDTPAPSSNRQASARSDAPVSGSGVTPSGGLAIGDASPIRYPTGKWGFVGARIPMELAYRQEDGSPVTAEQARAIRQSGPGFVRGIKRVTFETEQEAKDALAAARGEAPSPVADPTPAPETTTQEPNDDTEPVQQTESRPGAVRAGGVREDVGGEPVLDAAPDVRGDAPGGDAVSGSGEDRAGGAGGVRGDTAELEPARGAEGDAAGRGAGRDPDAGARAGNRESAVSGARGAEPDPVTEPIPGADYQPAESEEVADRITPATVGAQRGENFRYGEDLSGVLSGGPVAKAKNNLAAVKLAAQIEEEGRPATRDEQAILAKYVGWGPLRPYFDPKASDATEQRINRELRAALTSSEYEQARVATQNAHYTDPRVARAMWDLVRRLGYTGGTAIEPAVGSGIFLGTAPEGMPIRWTAGDLDGSTARIARLLYPNASVQHIGFQHMALPDNSVDLFISNVPFGKYGVSDRAMPRFLTTRIHDYFFAKALRKTRPGGLVVFITSDGTMDKSRTKVREWMAEQANLVTAIRLPQGAFQEIARTGVTTDLIVLQKRAPGEAPSGPAWTDLKAFQSGGEAFSINEYYAERPAQMLGTMAKGGMYNADDQRLVAREGEDLAAALAAVIARAPEGVYTAAPVMEGTRPAKPMLTTTDAATVRYGSFQATKEGIFLNTPEGLVEAKVPATEAPKVRQQIAIRDAYKAAMAVQRDPKATDAQVSAALKKLNTLYDAFVKQFGPINVEKHTPKTRKNKETGDTEEYTKVEFPNLKYRDAESVLLMALEDYDHDDYLADKKVKKGAALLRRTQFPTPPEPVVATPADAMMRAVNESGGFVSDKRIAELLEIPVDRVESTLGDLVFRDPDSGRLETPGRYLAGDVKTKLALAKDAASRDPKFKRNVAALEPVIPPDIPPPRIPVQFGATWIPTSTWEAFFRDVFRDDSTARYEEDTGKWYFSWGWGAKNSNNALSVYGTKKMPAWKIIERLTAGKAIEVKVPADKEAGTPAYVDEEQTQLAQSRAEELKAKLRAWMWEDPDRAENMVSLYNDLYNRTVSPQVDGSYLTLPGMATTLDGVTPFAPMPHQKNGIARALQYGNTALVWEVGTGKTIALAGIAVESIRTGRARKALIEYPNQLMTQWPREFRAIYPDVRVLAVTEEDMANATARQAFMARAQAGDFDVMLVPESVFYKIQVSEEKYRAYYEEEIDQLEEIIRARKEAQAKAKGKDPDDERILMDLIAALQNLQTKLENMSATDRKKDDGIVPFEELGVDLLLIDEVHRYKNLFFQTTREKMSATYSQRAMDFLLKTRHMHEVNPGRGLMVASGTIVANNTAPEMYAMMRYLQPDALAQLGLSKFDNFIAAFASESPDLEQKADGTFEFVTKVDGWPGARALRVLSDRVFDVLSIEGNENALDQPRTVKIRRPPLLGGKPRVVETPSLPEIREFMGWIISELKRLKTIPKEKRKGELTVPNYMDLGVMSAIDMRLVKADAEFNPNSKLAVAMSEVARLYAEDARVNGTIVVFLDQQNPSSRFGKPGFHTHAEMIRQLTEIHGIPRKAVASVALAKDARERARMIKAANQGEVRIILGTSASMGVGVNLQKRTTRIVHIDPKWRPDEITQRNGRAVRQRHGLYDAGLIEGVEEIRFSTADSLDGVKWSKVARKMRSINSLIYSPVADDSGDVDLDSNAEEISQIMAIASGNPYLVDQARNAKEIRRLRTLQTAEASEAAQKASALRLERRRLEEVQERLRQAEAAAQGLLDLRGDKFAITIDGKTYTKRPEATEAIADLFARNQNAVRNGKVLTLGTIGGRPITVSYVRGSGFVFAVQATNGYQVESAAVEGVPSEAPGYLRRIEFLYSDKFTDDVTRAQHSLAFAQGQVAELSKYQRGAFSKQAELDAALARDLELKTLITAAGKPTPVSLNDPTPPEDLEDDTDLGEYNDDEERFAYTDPVSALIGQSLRFLKKQIAELERDTRPLYTSEFEEVEARMKKAEGGLPTVPWLAKAKAAWQQVQQDFQRHFPHLDTTKDAMHALAHELLLRAERSGSWSKAKAADQLLGVVQGLSKADVQLMTRFLALEDILADLDAGLYADGRPLPFGYETREDVEMDLGRIDYQVGQRPAIKAAIDRRNATARALTVKLVQIDALPKSVLDDPRYYHRQVLSYAEERVRAQMMGSPTGAGTPREVRQRKRGFQKGRVGGGDFNLAWQEAEYEWVAQANQTILLHELLAAVKQMDQTPALKAQANALNLARFEELNMEAQGVEPGEEGYEDPLQPFRAKIAMAKARIVQAIARGDLDPAPRFQRMVAQLLEAEANGERFSHPQWWAFLSDLAATEHPSGAHISALSIFKAIRDRKALIEQTLGDSYLDPTDPDVLVELAGPGYRTWQPEKGNVFYSALTLPEKALLDGTLGTLEGDQLRRAMVMGGRKPTWILPEGIALTLDDLTPAKTPESGLVRGWVATVRGWKAWTLLSPARALKYNFNNLAGDLDASMLAPPVVKQVPGAARDLWQYMMQSPNLVRGTKLEKSRNLSDPALVAEMQEAIQHGVVDQGLTATEIPDIVDLPGFERLATATPLGFMTLVGGYWKHARLLTNYRENILRLAAWRHFKAELAAGRRPLGVSNRRRVTLLDGRPVEQAALLARDLVGDYGNITVAGESMRERLFPFYSWMEVNAKRYVNFARNLPYEETGPVGGASRLAASVAARVGLSGASLFLSLGARAGVGLALASGFMFLVAAINAAFHPDEWGELRKTGRDGHLILGTTADGRILTVRLEGAFADFLSWVGLKDLPADIRDVVRGQQGFGDVLEDAVKAPVAKLVGALEPTSKTLMAFFTKKQTFPDPFNPRPVRDPATQPFGVWFDQWGLGTLYRQVLVPTMSGGAIPATPTPPTNPLLGLLAYQVDAGEVAYNAIRSQAYEWQEKQGKPAVSNTPDDKANALYFWKLSTKWGEPEAAAAWLKRYRDLGGTTKGAAQSIKRAEPLAHMTQAERRQFMATLTPADHDRLARAQAWYRGTMKATGGATLRGVGRPPATPAPRDSSWLDRYRSATRIP